MSNDEREKLCERLYSDLAHGDDEHRAWLKAAIEASLTGAPMPPVTGKGASDAKIAMLTTANERKDAEIAGLRGALENAEQLTNIQLELWRRLPGTSIYAELERRRDELIAERRAALNINTNREG